jgi:choline kinase
MRYVVLGAGRGTRMGAKTDDLPKVLVPIAGGKTTIIGATIDHALRVFPEMAINIVVGYRADRVATWLLSHPRKQQISLNENTNFLTTSPLTSLKIGFTAVGPGAITIVSNGDTVIGLEIFETIRKHLAHSQDMTGIYLFGSQVDKIEADDVKILLNENHVRAAGKKLIVTNSVQLISAGFCLIVGSCAYEYFHQSLLIEENFSSSTVAWHNVFGRLHSEGHKVEFIQVPRNTWAEFDTVSDLMTQDGYVELVENTPIT